MSAKKVTTWIEASETKDRYVAIHPSGNDPAKWEQSGKGAAHVVDHILSTKYPGVKSVLDYGCGTCRVLKHLPQSKYELHGVDIAPNFVKESKEMGFDCKLLGDCHEQYDAVFSLTVFIHLNKVDGKKALQYCYDHLKPGGIALIQAPIYDVEKDPETWTHVGTWGLERFKKVCREIGFELLDIRGSKGHLNYERLGVNHGHYQQLKKPIIKME